MTKRVVMFSGGIGSWATAKIVAERYGTDDLYLVFADVKGSATDPHIGEDEDTYRFIKQSVANIGGTYIYLNEGRDIWQLFEDQKFLGNSRVANCSKLLKQRPARKWLKENCDPADTVIYVGIDWTETHRLPAIVRNYLPYKAEAPLSEPPYRDKNELIQWAKNEGLDTPRLYEMGFAHNNCGGGCVRAGQGQFKKLLETMPERFATWEAKEQHLRKVIGQDVAILNEVVNGVKKPLPLIELRKRAESSPMLIDEFDIGGCACFVDFDDETDGVTVETVK
jgi:hypothetical protein